MQSKIMARNQKSSLRGMFFSVFLYFLGTSFSSSCWLYLENISFLFCFAGLRECQLKLDPAAMLLERRRARRTLQVDRLKYMCPHF